MALSVLKVRATPGARHQSRSISRCLTRAQASSSSTTVMFKIHRHVEYGQALLLVGSVTELGSWDAKQALELNWGDGDNWSTSAALPVGSSVEYKYIIKRRDGLDWSPGQNKAIVLPPASSVEVSDTWENPHSNIVTLAPLDDAHAVAETPTPAVAEVEKAPVVVADAAPLPETNGSESESETFITSDTNGVPEAFTAVSTVENLHVPELEKNGVFSPAILAAQHQQPPGLLANNIVQGAPLGAVAVSLDPITQYEEADKYQVVEVGTAEKVALAASKSMEARAAFLSATTAAKPLDKMTMAELRVEVKRRGISPLGNRRELLTRLQNAGVV